MPWDVAGSGSAPVAAAAEVAAVAEAEPGTVVELGAILAPGLEAGSAAELEAVAEIEIGTEVGLVLERYTMPVRLQSRCADVPQSSVGSSRRCCRENTAEAVASADLTVVPVVAVGRSVAGPGEYSLAEPRRRSGSKEPTFLSQSPHSSKSRPAAAMGALDRGSTGSQPRMGPSWRLIRKRHRLMKGRKQIQS